MWDLSCLSLLRGNARRQSLNYVQAHGGLRANLSEGMVGENLSSLNQVTLTVTAKQQRVVSFRVWAVRSVFLTHSNADIPQENYFPNLYFLNASSHSAEVESHSRLRRHVRAAPFVAAGLVAAFPFSLQGLTAVKTD